LCAEELALRTYVMHQVHKCLRKIKTGQANTATEAQMQNMLELLSRSWCWERYSIMVSWLVTDVLPAACYVSNVVPALCSIVSCIR
jgi:hypothetical protein